MKSTDDGLLQYLFDKVLEGYEEYKRNHPDFAKVIEEEEQKLNGNYHRKITHCESCGEWLDNYEFCPECGRINLH